jgi:hypothetical protein
MISEAVIDISTAIVPACERSLTWMFWATGLPLARGRLLVIPILLNAWLIGASLSMAWYPNYYLNQSEVWTADIALIWIVYSKMIWLQSRWAAVSCYESVEIPRWANRITKAFYWLFMVYWAYFAVIMFATHNESDALIQFKNTYMSIAWYLFFSVAALLYYFICVKLLQRGIAIHQWLESMKATMPTIDDFYATYNDHCKSTGRFSKNWNLIVFVGFLLLSFHVPIDLLSIFIDQNYYDIPGAIIKIAALSWYLYCICQLNDYNQRVISFLYKHRAYPLAEMQMIEQYVQRRHIGLDFYGIQINTATIMKGLLLILNLVVPALYGVIKKVVLRAP